MSETLLGVIIGGIIGLIPTLIVSFIEYKKWKKERNIAILQQKREKMEKLFDEAYEKIHQGMEEGSFSIDMITDILRLSPRKVSEAFDKMMLDKNESIENQRTHLLEISIEMKNSLAEIDKDIESIIK